MKVVWPRPDQPDWRLYTLKELMQWKSLKAYNYFENGRVRIVEIWPVDRTSCILRAMILVNPSQRSSDNPHTAWVAVKSDGQIITAHCTCMAR